MKTRKTVSILGLLLALAIILPTTARADEYDQASQLTFSQPVQIPGQVPQDRRERNHRGHRVYAPKQQGVSRPVGRNVRGTTGIGGEDVDVLLDTLVGVIDGVVDEQIPVIRLTIQPVIGEVGG